jgi:hypothetical protein
MDIVKKTVNDVTDRVDEAERFLTSPINRVLESLKLVSMQTGIQPQGSRSQDSPLLEYS